MSGKLLVINVAAMGHELLSSGGLSELDGLKFRPAGSVFPAVTCTAQASFRTAEPPGRHGMVASGLMRRDLARVMFWEQSAALVAGERIWSGLRNRGGRVGMLFWQQSLGEAVDMLLSPAPIHTHGGGMIQAVADKPTGLYGTCCQAVGKKFKLRHYWGPLASAKVGDWISAATAAVMSDPRGAPELLLTYLPTLDYDLQRHGPAGAKADAALKKLHAQLRLLLAAARDKAYEVLIFGDYAIGPAGGAVFPNRALADAEMMKTRSVGGMLYPDLHNSGAFAVVDHEIAHVYVRNPGDLEATKSLLASVPSVAEVIDESGKQHLGLDHPNSGELVLTAAAGKWFAYPWWRDKKHAPDYASHVDIHNKPGFDPCELFFGWPPISVSQDASRIRGTHGGTGPGREIAWAATVPLGEPADLIGLAQATKDWLNQ